MTKVVEPWLGTGLILSSGEWISNMFLWPNGHLFKVLPIWIAGKKWHQRRKMLTPAFHFKVLEKFQQIFDEKAKTLVSVINEKLMEGQDVLEMHSFFGKTALDIICGSQWAFTSTLTVFCGPNPVNSEASLFITTFCYSMITETAMGKQLNCTRDSEHPFLKATLRFWILLYFSHSDCLKHSLTACSNHWQGGFVGLETLDISLAHPWYDMEVVWNGKGGKGKSEDPRWFYVSGGSRNTETHLLLLHTWCHRFGSPR